MLSFRDVEDLLAERGITVSYEAIRCRCIKFGPRYAQSLRRKQGRLGDIWIVDEAFISISARSNSKPISSRAAPSQGSSLSTLPQASFISMAKGDLHAVKNSKFACGLERL
jgi:hypothetical protein